MGLVHFIACIVEWCLGVLERATCRTIVEAIKVSQVWLNNFVSAERLETKMRQAPVKAALA